MKELSITKLAEILNASHEHRASSIEHLVSGISTDSRTVGKGDCFFAIKGPNFDGHNFVADAFAKGASCAVVSKSTPISNQQLVVSKVEPSAISNKVVLRVDDTVKSLGALAAWYRKECSFKVVAITGSVGKTTTREIIYHVLSAVGETSPMGGSRRFKTFQSPKNFNNFIGLPLTLLEAGPDCQIVVAELGTNRPGEIEYLAKICSPDIALITAVAPAHLEGFGNLESLTREKLSISEGLEPAGTLILTGDCPDLVALAQKQRKKFLTFGSNSKFDYHAENLRSNGLSSDFKISNVEIHLPLPGRGNAYNALAAWAVADQFKITIRDFADAVKTISPVSMRTEILQISSSANGRAVGETPPQGGLTVIDDCYNANPASMKNALDILTTLSKNQNRRAVFVCGDMAELGSYIQKFHVELGEFIAKSNIGLLLTVGHLALIAADRVKKLSPSLETHSFISCEQLAENLHKLIKPSDVILVKGSRVNKLELAVEKLKILFHTG
jgi:UDP-N-acetylmuramoyl-tripeptide--D-alanyl-D-alanine ligase